MMASIQASTWRQLGLGVAVSYALFGLSGILFPQTAAQSAFGIAPAQSSASSSNSGSSGTAGAAVLLTPLIGVRDLTIATTLAMLYHRQLGWEMGFVIVSRTVFCIADTWLIARRKGLSEALPAGGGLAIWIVIGIGLLSSGGI